MDTGPIPVARSNYFLEKPRGGALQLRAVGAFDADPAKIGLRIGDLTVQPMEALAGVVKAKRVDLAILTVPASAAQAAAEAAISAGIEGLLNFAPARVTAPDGVSIESVDLSVQLDRLAFRLTQRVGATFRSPD